MSKPFKFRYVNELVGSFVIVVVGLLLAALFGAAKSQGWFDPEYRILIGLPASDSMELPEGATVSLMNKQVGAVDEVRFNQDGSLAAVLRLRGVNVQRLVRKDSKVMIKRKLGVTGDFFVSIYRGKGQTLNEAELSGENQVFIAELEFDLPEQVLKIAQELKGRIDTLFDQVGPLVDNVTRLTARFEDPKGDFQQILGSTNRLLAAVEKGQGTVGLLLKDEEVAAEFKTALVALNGVLEPVNALLAGAAEGKGTVGALISDEKMAEDIKGTLGGVNELVASMNDLTNTLKEGKSTVGALLMDEALATEFKRIFLAVNGLMKLAPDLMGEAGGLVRELERLVTAMQAHWLFRKYVEEEQRLELLSPGMRQGVRE